MELSVLERSIALLKSNEQIMGRVSTDPRNATLGATTRIIGWPPSLLHWCHMCESVVVRQNLRSARVFAGFERFSRTRFVRDRYSEIGRICQSLTVVGLPDEPLAFPTTATIEVASGPLLREWFLLIESPNYCGLLAARDLDGLDTAISPRDRRFEGVITHHPKTIRALADELDCAVEEATAR